VRASLWITKTLRRVKMQQRSEKKLVRGRTALEESDDSDGNFAFGITNKQKKKVMNVDEEIQYEHPDIPLCSELTWNFLLTPMIMYSGLGRLVIVSERKKTF